MPSVLCEVKLRPELPSLGLRDELSIVVPHWCGGGALMSSQAGQLVKVHQRHG